MAASVGWHGVTHRHAHPTAHAAEHARRHVDEECSVSLPWRRKTESKTQEKAKDYVNEGNQEENDSANVTELRELFSAVEQEHPQDGIDLQVLLEGEHALNVEDVSDIFSELEDTTSQGSATTEDDAANVDELAALFSAIDDHDQDVKTVETADIANASNVQSLANLFSELDSQEQGQLNRDWIASLDVDDVSGLFSELEQLEKASVSQSTKAVPVPVYPEVDSRIFVPTFSVRIEGQNCVSATPNRLSPQLMGGFLAGPPGLRSGGPPLPTPSTGTGKRKLVSHIGPAPRPSDESISETRRACAAKRRRVNGRFVREQNAFVAITSLQQ